MIMLTDAERVRLSQAVETDEGTGQIAAVVYAVESIVAARTAALLDRIERAETERDEQRARKDIARRAESEMESKFVKMREAFKREHEWRKNRDADLAALRAAVTNLAEWRLGESSVILKSELRSLLAAAPTETEGEPCHCGQPVVYGYDGNPAHTRGLCEHCDLVRCDAYPGECGR